MRLFARLLLLCCASGCDRAAFEPPMPDAGPGDESGSSISADRDDGSFAQGVFAPQGDDRGWHHVGGSSVAYYRFRLVDPIAPDAIVQHARLRIWCTGARGWDPEESALIVRVEDSADAAQIVSAVDGEGRARGTASMRWAPSWRVAGWNQSPDLSPLFEELVAARGGLAQGAHVHVFVSIEGPDAEVSIEDFSQLAEHHAELRLRTR